MTNPELSRAFGKAMKDIRKMSNFKKLEDELLNAKSFEELSEECKKIVKKYL